MIFTDDELIFLGRRVSNGCERLDKMKKITPNAVFQNKIRIGNQWYSLEINHASAPDDQ